MRSTRYRLASLLAAAAIATVAAVPAGPAWASTRHLTASGDGRVAASVSAAAKLSSSAPTRRSAVVRQLPSLSASGDCTVPRGAYVGTVKCDSFVLDFFWEDFGAFPFNGRWETFVLGTDGQVYHIWQEYANDENWSQWYSLGGYQVRWGVGLYYNQPIPKIVVEGGDSRSYCKSWDGDRWTESWYLCGAQPS
jgi:hypothetical protein